jgi:hypothetical protein
MSEAIYIQHSQDLTRMELTAYDYENTFQKILADHPDLLAGDQINPGAPRKWLLIKREAGIPSEQGGNGHWSLDHLFIDQDAIPTLVEVKLKHNRELRRIVVGQMMDYAANAVAYWPDDTLKDYFYQTCRKNNNQDPQAVLAEFLEGNSEDLNDEEKFWQAAVENLRDGNVRLIFVADRIPPELQRIVEFLNERMLPTEVLALELRHYSGGDFSTHIPRVLGLTANAQIAKNSGIAAKPRKSKKWNEATLLEDASSKMDSAHVASLRKALELFKTGGFDKIDWGTGASDGSCSPKYMTISKKAPITLWSDGTLSIKLGWFYENPVEEAFRIKFQTNLQQAGLPYECGYNQIINVPVETWGQWIDQLLEVLRSAAEEVLRQETIKQQEQTLLRQVP